MSLMIASSAMPDCEATSAMSPWLASSGVSRSRSIMPSRPLSGVRISWLTLERNSDLARLASSAWRRASSARCACACASCDRRRCSASFLRKVSIWSWIEAAMIAKLCSSWAISTPALRPGSTS
jgi:hypothetical protein